MCGIFYLFYYYYYLIVNVLIFRCGAVGRGDGQIWVESTLWHQSARAEAFAWVQSTASASACGRGFLSLQRRASRPQRNTLAHVLTQLAVSTRKSDFPRVPDTLEFGLETFAAPNFCILVWLPGGPAEPELSENRISFIRTF